MSQQGYIAIISTFIVTTVLMLVVFTLSDASFASRHTVPGALHKQESINLTEACGEIAISNMRASSTYSAPEDVSFSNGQVCTILTATSTYGLYMITAEAQVENAYTKIEIAYNPYISQVITWRESF